MNTYTSHLNNLQYLRVILQIVVGNTVVGVKGKFKQCEYPLYILPLITIHNGDTLDCGG